MKRLIVTMAGPERSDNTENEMNDTKYEILKEKRWLSFSAVAFP